MSHAVLDEQPQAHMGLPLSNGKLAMWMFLVTEVMFFTALVGVYVLLRQSAPSSGASIQRSSASVSPKSHRTAWRVMRRSLAERRPCAHRATFCLRPSPVG